MLAKCTVRLRYCTNQTSNRHDVNNTQVDASFCLLAFVGFSIFLTRLFLASQLFATPEPSASHSAKQRRGHSPGERHRVIMGLGSRAGLSSQQITAATAVWQSYVSQPWTDLPKLGSVPAERAICGQIGKGVVLKIDRVFDASSKTLCSVLETRSLPRRRPSKINLLMKCVSCPPSASLSACARSICWSEHRGMNAGRYKTSCAHFT